MSAINQQATEQFYRRIDVFNSRENSGLTFQQLADNYGVSIARARQLYLLGKRNAQMLEDETFRNIVEKYGYTQTIGSIYHFMHFNGVTLDDIYEELECGTQKYPCLGDLGYRASAILADYCGYCWDKENKKWVKNH